MYLKVNWICSNTFPSQPITQVIVLLLSSFACFLSLFSLRHLTRVNLRVTVKCCGREGRCRTLCIITAGSASIRTGRMRLWLYTAMWRSWVPLCILLILEPRRMWKRYIFMCCAYLSFTHAKGIKNCNLPFKPIRFRFSHLADAFIQYDLQIRTMETININKRAMIRKCYDESQLA